VLAAASALLLLLGPACGPVESLVVIGDAKVAIEAARVADAERYAPFEYRAATEYHHKAREEMYFADYQEAIELAEISLKYAEGARMRALEHPRRHQPTVTPPPRPKTKPKVTPPPRPRVKSLPPSKKRPPIPKKKGTSPDTGAPRARP